MKYKVGDRVKIREDLNLDKTYGSYLTCNNSMVKKAGLVVTIKECDNEQSRYKIDADDWNWTDEMFEGLAGGEAEKAINLLREMKHNCEHANKYDDPKRHDKAKALGFAIELIEHDYSATELNYKPEKLMEKLSNQSSDSNAIRPDYYKFHGYDVFDMAAYFKLSFPLGNALKYLLRAGHKDPAKKIEDLRKCIQCIQRAIEIEGEKA